MDIQHQSLLLSDIIDHDEITKLLKRYGLSLKIGNSKENIPGSFWGDEEAGLIKDRVYARLDTPIHSLLHESCHYICMDEKRRITLNTNAGGTTDEENAVCYLQILLSDQLSCIDRKRMMNDMDHWGYNFCLGTAKAWFESDSEDTRLWLLKHKLIDKNNVVTFNLRR